MVQWDITVVGDLLAGGIQTMRTADVCACVWPTNSIFARRNVALSPRSGFCPRAAERLARFSRKRPELTRLFQKIEDTMWRADRADFTLQVGDYACDREAMQIARIAACRRGWYLKSTMTHFDQVVERCPICSSRLVPSTLTVSRECPREGCDGLNNGVGAVATKSAWNGTMRFSRRPLVIRRIDPRRERKRLRLEGATNGHRVIARVFSKKNT